MRARSRGRGRLRDAVQYRYITTLSGTQYGTLDDIISVASGDTVEVEFATSTTGTSMFLFGHSATPASAQFDAGDLLQLVGGTASIDGSPVADGASIAAYQDGEIHTLVFTATGSLTIGFIGQSGGGAGFWEGQILSVKFTDNSGAPVVTNYVFDSGSTVYQLPRGEAIQPDVVINGGFDADSDWTKAAGWTISGGKAICNTASDDVAISQNQIATSSQGKIVVISFDVTIDSGAIDLNVGGTGGVDYVTSTTGSHTLVLDIPGASTVFQFRSSGALVGTLDNVVVREIPKACTLTNFTTGGWEKFSYAHNPPRWIAADGDPVILIG